LVVFLWDYDVGGCQEQSDICGKGEKRKGEKGEERKRRKRRRRTSPVRLIFLLGLRHEKRKKGGKRWRPY